MQFLLINMVYIDYHKSCRTTENLKILGNFSEVSKLHRMIAYCQSPWKDDNLNNTRKKLPKNSN